MTPAQCRMARAALRWSTVKLAEEASASTATVNRFESGKDGHVSTAKRLRQALEGAGVTFEGDSCVCLKDV